ncbi:MAG TPA: rod shape-determining protein MreD [Steroidobacteraceae bacterium]|jgi:rod shape-determining protein MreD
MNARAREPRGRLLFTVVLALFLSVVPLGANLDAVRPAFLVLTVIYWSVAAPRAGGIMLGWLSGLALDVFQGSLLGEHALALSLVTYLAVREHQKVRAKHVFQQSLMVLGALVIYECVLFAIDGWTGHTLFGPLHWVQIVTGTLLWPVAAALLTRSHAPRWES